MAWPIVGKLLEIVADKGSSLISEFITDKDEANRLTAAFRSQLSAENHEIKQLEIEAERDMHANEQVTHQVALNQADLYTKRTRPKIARQSWFLTITYAIFSTIGAPLLTYFTAQTGPDGEAVAGVFADIVFQWEVFVAIASPALTYMGVRTFDKWKNGAK